MSNMRLFGEDRQKIWGLDCVEQDKRDEGSTDWTYGRVH